MSDAPQGLGWWRGKDGKWYPPAGPADVNEEEATVGTSIGVPRTGPDLTPAGIAARKEKGSDPSVGTGCLAVVVIVVVVWAIAAAIFDSGGDDSGSGGGNPEELEYGAFDVCTEFVKDRLRSPATASFPNFFEDDGEVVVTSSGPSEYTVRSSVDSENGFGALLTTPFTCIVRHTSGDTFQLVRLNMQ